MPILGKELGIKLGGALFTGGFNPLTTSPDVWLDSSDTSTISDTGTFTWTDKSGNGNNAEQAVAADKPTTGVNTLNGLNVVTLDSDFLRLVNNQPYRTAILVFNNVTAPVITGALIGSESPNAGYYTFIDPSSSGYDISLDGSGGYSGEASINGGSFVSGTNINLGRTPAENQGANVLVTRMDATNYVDLIGAFGSGGGTKVVGDIAEVFFWNRLLSDEEVDYMVAGLTNKWMPA